MSAVIIVTGLFLLGTVWAALDTHRYARRAEAAARRAERAARTLRDEPDFVDQYTDPRIIGTTEGP
jgi:cbb3-type cytochrome oxidase subunit 3